MVYIYLHFVDCFYGFHLGKYTVRPMGIRHGIFVEVVHDQLQEVGVLKQMVEGAVLIKWAYEKKPTKCIKHVA